MKTIWKYELQTTDLQILTIPQGGQIRHLGVQRGMPCLWVEVDPKDMVCERKFVTYGTGQPIEENRGMEYVGSYMLAGSLVFHVYELKN